MVEAAELARLRQGRAFAGQATGSEFFFFFLQNPMRFLSQEVTHVKYQMSHKARSPKAGNTGLLSQLGVPAPASFLPSATPIILALSL